MLPRRAVLVSFALASFLAGSAHGQSADLRVTVEFPLVVARATRPFYYSIAVQNLGPDPANDVTVFSLSPIPGYPECRYTFTQPLPAGQSTGISCTGMAPNADTIITVRGGATSTTADPDQTNNTATKNIAVATNPDLGIDLGVPVNVEPGLPFELSLYYWNSGGGDALNTTIRLNLPPGVDVQKMPPQCHAESASYVECDLGTVPLTVTWDPSMVVKLQLLAPDTRGGGDLRFRADILNSRPEFETSKNLVEKLARLYRAFLVENTEDAGPGSLRQAITDANAQCSSGPCEIQFRLRNLPSAGRWSIGLESPLPVVTANNLMIDGTTQDRFEGDENTSGRPKIEISGEKVAESDGLVVESPCDSQVRALTLNGFAGAAIRLRGSRTCDPATSSNLYLRRVSGNFIGTDWTGSSAVPNLRGIVVEMRGGSPYAIEKNVISGNTRSALFIDSPGTLVWTNVIGLDFARTSPLSNGASGIFVSKNAMNTDIAGNVIAFNHEFGIAIERGARLTEIHGNSIHANWQPGIDIGLDGATADTDDPKAPQVDRAFYDASTDTTVIEGMSYGAGGTFGPIIRVFANDAPDRSGFGQGQYYLGQTFVSGGVTGGGYAFSFTWPGDLRGKFIAATATRVNYYGWLRIGDPGPDESSQGFERQTSEFSRTIEVH